ncbi:MAG: VWA domain-containing protein [Pseudoxanthomonas sp.]
MNDWLPIVHFLRPHWLWALLALPLLWWLWRMRRRRANVWHEAVDAHLLPHLLEPGRGVRVAPWLGLLGYALAILALAGPSWRQGEQALWQAQAPLVVALDLSSASSAADLPPSRLLRARSKLAALLRERRGGQVALVVYAGDAFTVAPLTDDAGNVALFIDALEPAVMPVDGQDAARAIDLSAKLLRQAGFSHGDVLLLADHADAAARDAARKAASEGFRVSAIGMGTAAGAAYRAPEGAILRARLDAASLRSLVAAGGGDYAAMTTDDGDLHALGVLDPQQAGAQAARGETRLAWRDEGYWLLLPLMLLGLLAFRRGGALAAVALCVLLPLASPAQAAEDGWWWRPDQQQQRRIAQGVDAYRKGDFATAEQGFAGIDSADAQYNLGNALARQGRFDEAIAAYDAALRQQPGMEDAIANRKVVEEARKQQKQNGDGGNSQQNRKQDSSDKNNSSQGQNQQGNGQREPQQDKSQQQDSQDKPDKDAAGNPDKQPPEQSQNAQDQQAADAAQRERMREAMQQAQAEKQGKAEENANRQGTPTETAEQRERRQATEAWLRRVPDEPGGLLRSKFRLEYERRQREGR